MGKVGAAEIYTQSNGWMEIDLYDPSDFSFTPVEMATANGVWGVPYVTSPSNADTPLELYTQSNGWQGINSTGYVVMDAFEDADLAEWVESQDTGIEVTSSRAAFQGNYGLHLDAATCERIVSAPSFTTSLPEYPSPGEQWDSFLRFDDADSFNNDLWHKYGCQTYPTSNGFEADETTDGYRAELDGANSYMKLWREQDTDGDGLRDTQTELASTTVNLNLDQWYRFEMDWGYSGASGDHILRLYEVSKSDWEGTQIASLGPVNDTTFTTEGAISCAAKDGVHWDLLRRTAPL